MKTLFRLGGLVVCFVMATLALAQTPPRFNTLVVMTNREVVLNLSNAPVQILSTTNLFTWRPLVTLTQVAASLSYTDSAAPYLSHRFYRAQAAGPTNLSGDYLETAEGDVLIRS